MIIRFGIIHLLATCVATWAVIELITRHNKFLNFLLGIALGFVIAGLSIRCAYDLDFQLSYSSLPTALSRCHPAISGRFCRIPGCFSLRRQSRPIFIATRKRCCQNLTENGTSPSVSSDGTPLSCTSCILFLSLPCWNLQVTSVFTNGFFWICLIKRAFQRFFA